MQASYNNIFTAGPTLAHWIFGSPGSNNIAPLVPTLKLRSSCENPMCQSRACCKEIIVGSLQFITEDMKKLVKSLCYSLLNKPDRIEILRSVLTFTQIHYIQNIENFKFQKTRENLKKNQRNFHCVEFDKLNAMCLYRARLVSELIRVV